MAYPASTAMDTVRGLLENQIRACWVEVLGQTLDRVAWQNVKFDPPEHDYWAKPILRFGLTQDFTFGGPGQQVDTRLGILLITIWGPKGVGLKPFYQMAGKFTDHFRRRYYGQVYVIPEEGPTELTDDSKAGVQIAIGFRYEETWGTVALEAGLSDTAPTMSDEIWST